MAHAKDPDQVTQFRSPTAAIGAGPIAEALAAGCRADVAAAPCPVLVLPQAR